MTKKVAYNLNFLAKSIFDLDDEYQKILRILASQKEYIIGINQTRITHYFKNSEKSLTRRTVNKKLFGARKTMGLIPTEYVTPRKENKKRYGKSEITFHLTFKGLFGALASGVPLKRISIYKNFLKVIDHYITDKKINHIIKQYYELQIHSFLLWHYIYGIQLKKTTLFQTYYSDLDKREFSHIEYFGIKLNYNIIKASKENEIIFKKNNTRNFGNIKEEESKDFVNEITSVFSSYFTYKGIISLLRISGMIPTTDDFLKPHIDIDYSNEDIIFDKLINDWSIYIESVYQAKTLVKALFDDIYEIPNQPNIRFLPQAYRDDTKYEPEDIEKIEKESNVVYIQNVTNNIQKILKKNNIEIDIPEEGKRSLNVYPF